MSERYSRLFTLPENLYAVGSPVVIAAGALLKDNHTGKIVAQMKLRSISNKIIRAVKVSLSLFDTAGNPIGNVVEYEYLDLDASRDTEFGQKNPVFVAESKARSYKAAVTEVVFADKTTWTASDADWEPLPRQKTLDAVLVNAELIKQYKITVGSNLSYYPLEEKDLWYCACGALNRENESCHTCHRSLFELQTIDLEQLSKDRDARLVQEAAVAEAKAAAERVAAEAAKKKVAKILKVVIPTVCAVVAVTLLTTKVIIPNSKYNKAVNLMDAGQYEEAIAAFEAMDGYKDSAAQIIKCKDAIITAEQARIEAEMAVKFAQAEELLAAGDYDGAIAIYKSLADYEGSAEGIEQAESAKQEAAYRAAEAMAQNGQTVQAAISFAKLYNYKDAQEKSAALWNEGAYRETVSGGGDHSVALKTDGTVVAVGDNSFGQCDVSNWNEIVAVCAGYRHTVGLKADGTVVAVGFNGYNQCDLSDWKDIVSIDASWVHTVGLCSDGTVVAKGENFNGRCDVGTWTDIVAISISWDHTVGLRADGTVVAVGNNENGRCDVNNWTDIVAIAAGQAHTVGLRSDGTVVAVGHNGSGQCDVNSWNDIVAISVGENHTIGLRADGTIVTAGSNIYGKSDVSAWRDILLVNAGSQHTLGLRENGTVVAVGDNKDGQCNVSSWKNIKLPN